jgi:hypothetical protein
LDDINSSSTQGTNEIHLTEQEPSQKTKKKTLIAKKNGTSDLWKHFKVYKEIEFKDLTEIKYTTSMSTGMLSRHLRNKHRKIYDSTIEEDIAKKKQKLGVQPPIMLTRQSKISQCQHKS